MNFEREKADILFNYGLLLQFCCHLIQIYTVSSLRTATLMNSERENADILFNHGLPLQFCCHLIQFYTVLSLRTATLIHNENTAIIQTFLMIHHHRFPVV